MSASNCPLVVAGCDVSEDLPQVPPCRGSPSLWGIESRSRSSYSRSRSRRSPSPRSASRRTNCWTMKRTRCICSGSARPVGKPWSALGKRTPPRRCCSGLCCDSGMVGWRDVTRAIGCVAVRQGGPPPNRRHSTPRGPRSGSGVQTSYIVSCRRAVLAARVRLYVSRSSE